LQHLVTHAVEAPVLVVTGFAEHESAVAAIKLGAVDYKSKPLLDDDLLHAVRRLVCAPSPSVACERDTLGPRRISSLAALDDAARRLAAPTIGALEFVLLATSFRRLAGDSHGRRPIETRRPYCTAQETAFATDLLEQVARALATGLLPTLDGVAHDTAVPAEHVNQILKVMTHSGFRECRRALRVRPTVPDVAFSHEQIAQIAYHHGYQWPGQLDRDFKATLLLTPNEFRRLFQTRLVVVRDRS
jgi:YesN/AraC family two-component response regulator